jgi:hypothetical protein
MRLGRAALAGLLMTNAVELRFRRRIKKPGFRDYRRMFCTNDRSLLSSPPGLNVLNFSPSRTLTGLKYNPVSKNLISCWDIFMQGFRMVSCDDVEVIAVIKTTPPEGFWKYFQEKLASMPAVQKAYFMNT